MPVITPPRMPLASLPTPLVRLDRLEASLGAGTVLLKRDDLTGLELSGNKVRKLEYILADARTQGVDTIVTEGTCQSNHCRATAAVCARLGLGCELLFRPQPPHAIQGNHLLDRLFGAQTRSWPREQYSADRTAIIDRVLGELRGQGRRPRFVPAGASEPLGCWGYIRQAAELATQLHAAGVTECDVVVAVSSGGTYAGLVLGKLLHRLDQWNLLAVPVSDDVAYHRREVGRLCREAIDQYHLPIEFDENVLQFVDGYIGAGYGVFYDKALEALRLLARCEAILLDPVYTAKAFCALVDGVRDGKLGRSRPVVFVHTGGVFSDFAWPQELLGSRT